jgi:glutathione S-transferase
MLEEIGIPYERVPIRPYTESRAPDYLRLSQRTHSDPGRRRAHPLGVACDQPLSCERYAGAPLWPAGAQDHGRIYQWSLWAANEVEPRIVSIARGLSAKSPDPPAVAVALEQLGAVLRILEDRLHQPFLLGDDFTAGDLNLASTLREPGEDGISGIAAIDLGPFPKVARWLDVCGARPANRRVASTAH